ncbi:MAG: M20/M25/M40 family metallo-hydrolase [Thermomicrobiales bacterium]
MTTRTSAPATTGTLKQLRAAVRGAFPATTALARRLIQTPSPSGDERRAADLVIEAMRGLGYDDVWRDDAGNVIGHLRGAGSGARVQFNTHLDHVSPGDHALWARPPFGGVIEDGILYGRGASDLKGSMAAQIALVPALREAGLTPRGDIFVVAVVLEEVGGFGSRHLATTLATDVAVVGEPSQNELRRGHRGRLFVRVTFTGLSTHASAPERGRNPHFAVARFLLAIETMPMTPSDTFGGSSMAPTSIETDQVSGNVTPGSVSISLDWRNVPGEDEATVIAAVRRVAEEAITGLDGIVVDVTVAARPVSTYTGMTDAMPSTLPFETAADDPAVTIARDALESAFGRTVRVGTWTFATDGGHLHDLGVRTIGFGPGEERHAHTIHDQISVAQVEEAVLGNAVLALALTAPAGEPWM